MIVSKFERKAICQLKYISRPDVIDGIFLYNLHENYEKLTPPNLHISFHDFSPA